MSNEEKKNDFSQWRGPEGACVDKTHRSDNSHPNPWRTPLTGRHLQRPGTNIVAGRVTQDMIQSVLFADVAATLADDHAELGFVIARAVLRHFRDVDRRRPRIGQGGARFGEQDRRRG